MASPTKWNVDDKFTFLSVSSDGLEVTYVDIFIPENKPPPFFGQNL
ncbi:12124_t:CDS:2 [Dentiscutata erythropus]|uniref:12124_t:CDS:1 n=1 Tax=Dentiscutata erythropus TaxID=1348616 RepID=A0A9N9G1J1_9GLOM|nr:12124_t:CDS:2 [Dentiscutata erythropus]